MKQKIKSALGDICEVNTPRGFGYFQVTHQTSDMGQLIRILPGLYSVRPADLCDLGSRAELYFVFFPLDYALRAKTLEVVANCPVPESAREFPVMRKEASFDKDGVTRRWMIGHGLRLYTMADIQKATFVETLSLEQKKLSIAHIWGFPWLVKRLAEGWLPQLDEEFSARARAEEAERKLALESERAQRAPELEHYLYFPKKPQAKKAALQLELQGWKTTVKMGSEGDNWLLLAKQPAGTVEEEDVRQKLERLALQFKGEYDGWGMTV